MNKYTGRERDMGREGGIRPGKRGGGTDGQEDRDGGTDGQVGTRRRGWENIGGTGGQTVRRKPARWRGDKGTAGHGDKDG